MSVEIKVKIKLVFKHFNLAKSDYWQTEYKSNQLNNFQPKLHIIHRKQFDSQIVKHIPHTKLKFLAHGQI
jgi:hypothetical protein